jgi:hypothetical protein
MAPILWHAPQPLRMIVGASLPSMGRGVAVGAP